MFTTLWNLWKFHLCHFCKRFIDMRQGCLFSVGSKAFVLMIKHTNYPAQFLFSSSLSFLFDLPKPKREVFLHSHVVLSNSHFVSDQIRMSWFILCVFQCLVFWHWRVCDYCRFTEGFTFYQHKRIAQVPPATFWFESNFICSIAITLLSSICIYVGHLGIPRLLAFGVICLQCDSSLRAAESSTYQGIFLCFTLGGPNIRN